MEQAISQNVNVVERREREPSLILEDAILRGTIAEVLCGILDRGSWESREQVRDNAMLFQKLVELLEENISERVLRRAYKGRTYELKTHETLAHVLVSEDFSGREFANIAIGLIEETRLEGGMQEDTTFPDFLADTLHEHFPSNYIRKFPATTLVLRSFELDQTASIENPIEAGVHRYQLTPHQIAMSAAAFLPVLPHQLLEVVGNSFQVRYDLLATLVGDDKRLQAQIFAYANCRPQHIDLEILGFPTSKISAGIRANFAQTLGSWVPPEFYDLRGAAKVDPALSTDILIGLKEEKGDVC